MESCTGTLGLTCSWTSKKTQDQQAFKDGRAPFHVPNLWEKQSSQPRALQSSGVTFATAGPKINTGMKTSAQLQAHKSLGEVTGKGAESK